MDPDQTARKRRLVWIHDGRKTHYVGFVMTQLKVLNASEVFVFLPCVI
jgi:hypothetical protein